MMSMENYINGRPEKTDKFIENYEVNRGGLWPLTPESGVNVLGRVKNDVKQGRLDSPKMVTVENYIGGKFEAADTYIDSYDPCTGEVWAQVPDSDAATVDRAVAAAKQAFESWSTTPARDRSELMMKIADIIQSRTEEFAVAESRDQGKPIQVAREVDIPRAIHNIRFYATSILHHRDASTVQEHLGALNYSCRSAVGVAGLITPWNLPMYLLTFKIAPALATGNTMVFKPSEMTSVTAWMFCKVLHDAGVPAGVCNMVCGYGWTVGKAITSHPDTPLISFTGSTPTAEKIKSAAIPYTKKFSLELGGKNAAIVFDDADLDKCVPTAVRSSFANQGEVCLCTSRIYVQRHLYPTFLERFVNATRELTVGDPTDPKTKIGALISREHLAKVKGYISIAQEEGAVIKCGETVDTCHLPEKYRNGYFCQPTVITEVPDNSRLMQEEIFGPVTCIVPFDTEEEVIARVNDNKYGLCASIWSTNLGHVHRVAKRLQVGTVWCNCWLVRDLNMPFGGTKASGIGREGAEDSLEFFTELKTVCIQMN